MRASTVPAKFISILLLLVAQVAIALAAAPPGNAQQRTIQLPGVRLAQAQTQEVKAQVVKKRITIIYKDTKCISNQVRVDGSCKCPGGTQWNEGEQKCLNIVTKFVCPEGSTRVGDKCVRCPSEMYLYNGQCTCPEPLIKKGNRCEEIVFTPKCPPPTTMINGTCMMPCPAGTDRDEVGRCFCTESGTTLINGQCSCSEGMVERDNKCLEPPEIAISPAEVPGGNFDKTYPDTQFVGNGGTGPYTFKVEGKLPPGLTISPSGLLSGLPVEDGAFSFTVIAVDANQFEGSRNYSITIEKPEISDQPPCDPGMVRFGADCVKDGSSPIPPVVNVPIPPPPAVDLARPLQTQLKRIGCLTGSVDGIWGKGSRRALAKFAGRAGLQFSSEPTQPALDATRLRPEGFCPREIVQPKKPKTKPKTFSSKPRCSKIKYAFTRGNTCGCSGGRTFNGSQCVKSGGGPDVGTFICALAQANCKGQWYPPCTCISYPKEPPPPSGGGGCQNVDELGRCY
jgi:hypothetical protein